MAEHDGGLIGYAFVHKAFAKEAYRFCVELSIYFKKGNHYGMADALLKKVEEACIQKDINGSLPVSQIPILQVLIFI